MTDARTIVALGGGGFEMEAGPSALDDHVLSLARARSGSDRPRICLIPTASGDDPEVIAAFERRFAEAAEPTVLRLFGRGEEALRATVERQDAVYVTGGSTANLLALWRLHGLDRILHEAWERGVVLAGMSAGANCWFSACTTDSFGPDLRAMPDGLGFVDGSFCPHYHGEPQRRPLLLRLVGDGTLPAGFAVDDGAALVIHGTTLAEVVVSDPAAGAWWVAADGGGGAIETPLPTRYLGADSDEVGPA